MKILATLAGVLAPVSAFAATGVMENSTDICVFMFFGYCALIIIAQFVPVLAQFVPAIIFFICMVKVTVTVVSESFAVQKT